MGQDHNYSTLMAGLVAGYDFKGDAKDFSGNGNDGTVYGATLTTDQFGIPNSAYDLVSADSHKIRLGGDDTFKSVTEGSIIVRFKTDSLSSVQCYWDLAPKTTSSTGYLLQLAILTDGKIGILHRNNLTTQINAETTNSVISAGQYHTVIYTVSSSGNTLSVDGTRVPITYDTGSSSTSDFINNVGDTHNYWIGARKYNGVFSLYFDGKISFSTVHNVPLTADEEVTIHDLISKGYIYPYPKDVLNNGVTQ